MTDDFKSNTSIHSVEFYDNRASLKICSTASNIGDCMIIWFKSKRKIELQYSSNISSHFSTIADYFETFIDIDECIDFISSLEHEKVFLIISLDQAKTFITFIHDLSQLAYIYVYIETEPENIMNKLSTWINHFPIIRNNIYELNENLFQQLEHDVKILRTSSSPFTQPSMITKNNSIKDLNDEKASYRWNQLLLDALLKFPQK